MRRWTLRIVLLLVLGCVTTVAVAWGCAWHLADYYHTPIQGTRLSKTWTWVDAQRFFARSPIRMIPAGFVVAHSDMRLYSGFGWNLLEITAWRPDPPEFVCYERLASGWPAPAMTGAWLHKYDWVALSNEGVFPTMRWNDAGAPTILPVYPNLGFVINTLFYGVIWFGIFFGFGSARRALRKKRGLCPKCAYQLRGQLDAGCSECGWGRPEDEA